MPSLLQDCKIALVHDKLTVRGGAENALLELHRLFPKAPIYTPLYRPESFPEFRDARVITSSLNRFRYLRRHHQLALPLLPYFTEQLDVSDYDIVVSSSTSNAHGVLTRPETFHVCYCHTPMRWGWLPSLDPRASGSLLRRLSAHYLRLWDFVASQRVDYWIANSQATAARIEKFYRRQSAVVPPPVEMAFRGQDTTVGDYYLSVGRLVAQKRVDILVQAAKEAGLKLKIAGDGPERRRLEKLARGTQGIEFLGYVDTDQRNELYRHCRAFLFASEEDAGIVPIEAMSYGKPVIAYGRGGAAETVINGQTGVHFYPQTAAGLRDGVKRFERLKFSSLAIARHAAKFSPEVFRANMAREITGAWDDFRARKMSDNKNRARE